MNKASSKHLTYKHSPFWGCTVQEALVIFFLMFFVAFICSVIVSLFLGLWFVWFLSFLIIVFCGIKFVLRAIGNIKQGRQHGYLILKIQKSLCETFKVASKKFVISQGIWSRRRSIK